VELNGQALTLEQIAAVALGDEHVAISPSARPRIAASRKVIEEIVARDTVIYGVNTGFGKLSDVRVPQDELRQLQLNLVHSHACGIGAPLSEPEVRAMMLLRANVLTLGFSGIRWDVIELLCEMLNRRVHPVVPEKGSVGASGDLAPLAHLALSVIGEGEVFFEGQRMATADALRRAKLKALKLEAKEGLACQQHRHARGRRAGALRAQRPHAADISGAMSLEALKGARRIRSPFAGRAAAPGRSRGQTSLVSDGR
jgi:histidine ammonia-lyase